MKSDKSSKNSHLSVTLKDYAYQTLGKNFKKVIKPETKVLQDTDPEPLHQMRVGTRRLRTALQVFDPALTVSQAMSERRIGKIAHILGGVRDWDVMRLELETRYRPQVPSKEQRKIDAVLKRMQHLRAQSFEQLEETLKGGSYRKFKHRFQQWLEKPTYHEIAHLPLLQALPDLLVPLISRLLLHPGWLVGTEQVADCHNTSFQPVPMAQIPALIEQQGESLHSLRKQIKRVRYQTEFFIDFYNSAYAAQVEDFKVAQEILGKVQDQVVLREFLATELQVALTKAMPALVAYMQQEQVQAWQSWQTIQQRYLEPEFRAGLRSQLLTPQEVNTSVSALPFQNGRSQDLVIANPADDK